MNRRFDHKAILTTSIRKLFSMVITFSLVCSVLAFDMRSVEESKLVIAYIERCSRFIEWPEKSKIQNKDKSFNFYFYKANPLGDVIYKSFQEQTIKGKKVNIKIVNTLSELEDCHLLYVSSSVSKELKDIIEYCQRSNILTFSYTRSYAARGININFFKEDQKLNFEINTKSIKKSGLKISHLLLERARIIN